MFQLLTGFNFARSVDQSMYELSMQRVPPGPPSLHNPPDLLFKLQGKTKDV